MNKFEVVFWIAFVFLVAWLIALADGRVRYWDGVNSKLIQVRKEMK